MGFNSGFKGLIVPSHEVSSQKVSHSSFRIRKQIKQWGKKKMYTEQNKQQLVFQQLSSQLVHTLDVSWSTSLESLTRHWSAIITSITSSKYSGSALLPASPDPLLLTSDIFASRPYTAFMITRPFFASSSLRTRANVARISCTANSASLFFSAILLHENKNLPPSCIKIHSTATKNYNFVIILFHDSVQHINSPAQILSVIK